MQVLDNDQSNRIVLVLLGLLVLLVFMDYQARRHYQSLVGYDGDPAQAARERVQDATEAIKTPIKSTARDILGTSRQIVSDSLEEVEARARERVAREVEGQADQITEQISDRIRARNTIELAEGIAGRPVSRARLSAQDYYLYFIRFRNGRSELVRVRRKARAGQGLELFAIVYDLQKGPTLRERELINAFTDRVAIYSIKLEDAVVTLDVGPYVGSMGAHVIKDRLDQIVYTLTQFPEIHGVRLLVEGKSVTELGRQGVGIPAIFRAGGRKVHTLP